MTRRFYTFLIVFLSFTFGEAQENYNQELESDSAYQKTYNDAKVVDSVIMSGYVTDNPSYNRKFKDDFRKNTKQTILITNLINPKKQVGMI